MTMATDQKLDCRNNKVPLRKQSEIEELEEQETSPGSDQSDSTITADKESLALGTSIERQDYSPVLDDIPQNNSSDFNHVQNNPKLGKLTRSRAFEITSPPLEQQNLNCLESPTNGTLTKPQSKGKLEKNGSQSSEAGTSSSLSRDSSFDKGPYKDSTGIDLEEFIHKTLNKTQKDRSMLLKLETDINNFINEPKHHYLKFPQMSSYDRMLVHRISAFFGLDHNVDQTGKCVIVNKTSNTRIPDFSFRDHIESGEPGHLKKPKMIMKRSVNSLDDRESHYKLSAKSLMNNKAKSFEERKEQYEKVRSKIFKSCDESGGFQAEAFTEEEMAVTQIYKPDGAPIRPSSLSKNSEGNHLGSSTDSSGYGTDERTSSKVRGIPKANSFGGMTHVSQKQGPYKSYSMNKADSFNCSINSPLQRPGVPTPPGSRTDSSPLSRCSSSGPIQSPIQGYFPGQGGQQVYIVATDLNNIPPGSVILDPRTGQPFSNSDGSIYHHTPGQPPPQHTSVIQQQQMTPDIWNNVQQQQEMAGVPEVCHHLSSLSLNPSSISQQNSFESPGEPPGPPSMQGGAQIVMATQPQMQTVFTPQGPTPQGQFYPCPQNVQNSNVRFMYPVQTQGQQSSVAVESQPFTQNAQFQSPMTSGFSNYQGGAVQNVETVNQCQFPVHGNSENFQTYPIQYPSQSNYGQTTVYYSNVPTSTPQMGLVYNSNQGTFQSQIQPSQTNVSASNPAIAMQGSTPMLNMGQPVAVGNIQTPNTHNYMYPTMAQVGQPQQQQRTPNQIVQFPNVQVHNPTQTIPMVRNMQMNMQLPTQLGGVQQHQGMVAGQPSQVTVSAKNLTMEGTFSKFEAENKDCIMGNLGSPVVAGPPTRQFIPGFRAGAQITDVRLLGQSTFHPPVQQMQIHPQSFIQPQKQRSTGTYVSKQQKLKKSRSKDSDSPHHSIDSSDGQTGHVLEVYDLPGGMMQADADKLLKDLVTSGGAQLQFIHQENIQYQTDTASLPVSSFHKILAIFPSSAGANQILQTHSNSKNLMKR